MGSVQNAVAVGLKFPDVCVWLSVDSFFINLMPESFSQQKIVTLQTGFWPVGLIVTLLVSGVPGI